MPPSSVNLTTGYGNEYCKSATSQEDLNKLRKGTAHLREEIDEIRGEQSQIRGHINDLTDTLKQLKTRLENLEKNSNK